MAAPVLQHSEEVAEEVQHIPVQIDDRRQLLAESAAREEGGQVVHVIAQVSGVRGQGELCGDSRKRGRIRKRRDGTYIHIKHKSPPELIGEMDRRFRLNEGVLRHLTVLAVKESPRAAEEAARIAEGAAVPAVAAAPASHEEKD